MPAESSAPAPSVASASAVTPVPPVSERAAAAVLGSMLFLIVALTLLLVQNTLVQPASTSEAPLAADASSTADIGSLAHR